ncbi:hypothetical protein [Roseibacillus ishigakijimensis]|uniref:Uncharacterized protein n=1 Tax=Roseibacillus ishigakijimensis TaxID=454146 RepID=A0A934VL90_9BACT|nr:hypothetical protein [Roseibacillus ishigakijimensis]MBK1832982.1 hypothetical protein [Roseibacillus ishigakijimensis]
MKITKEVWQDLGAFLIIGLAVWAVLALSSCSQPGVPPSPVVASSPLRETVGSGARAEELSSAAADPGSRPGLGTGWGERVASSLARTSFERASDRPLGGVATIFYNDEAGIEAMAGRHKNRTSAFQQAANGAVEWGVKSGWGTPLHYMAGAKRFVVGKEGKNYSLVVRNASESRLEVVLSVDGLDVMDGRPASFKKRGYILGPGEKIEVKGFRTSYDAVAAFKFSTVAASYANLRHGQARDVGVIGLAVFTEKGSRFAGWLPGGEVGRRQEARPFAEAPLRTAQ